MCLKEYINGIDNPYRNTAFFIVVLFVAWLKLSHAVVGHIEGRRMQLSKLKSGNTGVIKSVQGSDKTCRFLNSLGCNEGEEITIISILAGNYIVSIKDCRYAIDKNLAHSIEVA